MAYIVKKKIEMSISDGLRELYRVTYDDTDQSNVSEFVQGAFAIAASQTDYAVNFGTVTTAKIIYLQPSEDITYKLGGTGNTTQTLRKDGVLVWDCSTTSLHISTTNAVTVEFLIAGA